MDRVSMATKVILGHQDLQDLQDNQGFILEMIADLF